MINGKRINIQKLNLEYFTPVIYIKPADG
jgi:hypothetical protein